MSKYPIKKYRIWFKQINEQYIDIHATSERLAIGKAKHIWRHDNPPEVEYIDLN